MPTTHSLELRDGNDKNFSEVCIMNTPKPQPNRQRYIEILRRMTPEQRLNKAFELSKFAKDLFITGIRKRFPDAIEDEIQKIVLERLQKCHNRNY